jgi:hypothetical protein
MTSTGGDAAPAADNSGPPSGEAVRSREGLASDLENLAEELIAKAKELKRAKRDLEQKQTMAGLWEAGLVVMLEYVDRVTLVLDESQEIVNDDPGASDTDTAQDALAQLDEAVYDAKEAIDAAIDSLESDDQPFRSTTRSKSFRNAADQLSELGQRCEGLAVHLRGPEAL